MSGRLLYPMPNVTLGKKVTIQQMELVKRVKIWYSIKNQWFYLLNHWRTQKKQTTFWFFNYEYPSY